MSPKRNHTQAKSSGRIRGLPVFHVWSAETATDLPPSIGLHRTWRKCMLRVLSCRYKLIDWLIEIKLLEFLHNGALPSTAHKQFGITYMQLVFGVCTCLSEFQSSSFNDILCYNTIMLYIFFSVLQAQYWVLVNFHLDLSLDGLG